jgi:hypothetical protein
MTGFSWVRPVPTSGVAEGEVGGGGAGNEVAGDVGESLVAVAGVIAQLPQVEAIDQADR